LIIHYSCFLCWDHFLWCSYSKKRFKLGSVEFDLYLLGFSCAIKRQWPCVANWVYFTGFLLEENGHRYIEVSPSLACKLQSFTFLALDKPDWVSECLVQFKLGFSDYFVEICLQFWVGGLDIASPLVAAFLELFVSITDFEFVLNLISKQTGFSLDLCFSFLVVLAILSFDLLL